MAGLDDEISRILGGITSETILQDAAKGDFAHVMKLKDHFVKCSPKIDNLLIAKCAVQKRNLVHWLAHHKQLEILKWICGKDPHSVSSSSGSQGRHWPTIAKERKFSRNYFIVNAQDVYGFTALHLATWGRHKEVVKALLAYDTWVDVDTVAENMHGLDGNKEKLLNGQTVLHIAAANGKFSIVKMILDCLKDRMQNRVNEGREELREALSIKSTSGKTALHYAAEHGKWKVVRCLVEAMKLCGGIDIVNNCDLLRQTPLYLAVSQQNAEAVEILLREGEGLKVNTVTWEGITPLDKAKSNEADCQRRKPSPKYFAKKTDEDRQKLKELKKEEKTTQRIEVMLESYDVNWLQAERAKYANAANCLLVGAALIASITYAGWLQPPLGITQYYEFPISNGAAPPESFESYVGVQQHQAIQLFWIFNSLSFFCSVATFIIGADAGIPQRCASMRDEVVQLRQSTVKASFILSFAIIGVMGAFSVAGIVVLPPIERQRAPTYVTVALGVIFCLILLMQFMKKLWIWFWSPSLQFKREGSSREGSSQEGLSQEGSSQEGLSQEGSSREGSSQDVELSKKRVSNDGPCEQVASNDRPSKQVASNDGSPKQVVPNNGPFILGNANLEPSKPRNLDFESPMSGSANLESPIFGGIDFESPMPRSPNLEPSTQESVGSVSPMVKSANLGPPTPGSANYMPSTRRSIDFMLSMPRNASLELSTPRSVDSMPSTSRSRKFVPPMLESADLGQHMLQRVNSMPSMLGSTNSVPLKLRNATSVPHKHKIVDSKPLEERPRKRIRTNISETFNSKLLLGKQKDDNYYRPFEEQQNLYLEHLVPKHGR